MLGGKDTSHKRRWEIDSIRVEDLLGEYNEWREEYYRYAEGIVEWDQVKSVKEQGSEATRK